VEEEPLKLEDPVEPEVEVSLLLVLEVDPEENPLSLFCEPLTLEEEPLKLGDSLFWRELFQLPLVEEVEPVVPLFWALVFVVLAEVEELPLLWDPEEEEEEVE
jgi:hypothetical protein